MSDVQHVGVVTSDH